jgi:hypothetical protein
MLVYFNAHRKDPQAHRYRCSIHPEVLNIICTGKHVSTTESMLNPPRSIKDGDDRDIEKIAKVF